MLPTMSKNSMEKILIVDGNNLLFQMFYGMPAKLYNKKHDHTIHATIGFISYVIKQIRLYSITKAVVVFDSDSSKERLEVLPSYKQNRNNDWDNMSFDEIPFNEEENIVKCLKFLGIKVIYSLGMEADDVIASIVKLFEKENEVIVSSFDSDFFQLINSNVKVLRYRGKASVLYDEALFMDKFGFSPDKYVLYKAIVGDTSDNILGVKGIGLVTGRRIVKEEANLSKKVIEALESNRELIERNIKLIKLEYRSEIDYFISDFSFDLVKVNYSNSLILSSCNIFN